MPHSKQPFKNLLLFTLSENDTVFKKCLLTARAWLILKTFHPVNLWKNEICLLKRCCLATSAFNPPLALPELLPFSSPFPSISSGHQRIRSGHSLIVRPTGSAGLQQSEGSTLPRPHFSAWHRSLECHVRRDGGERNRWRLARRLLSAGFWLGEVI